MVLSGPPELGALQPGLLLPWLTQPGVQTVDRDVAGEGRGPHPGFPGGVVWE